MRWLSDPLLVVEGLTMRFGGLLAVRDLSFAVGRGDITAIIGPNGAGKTTVFNCITGFYKPTSGLMALSTSCPVNPQSVASLAASGRRYQRREEHGCDDDLFLLERMPDFEIARKARVARTFQNIRLFPGMTVLENLIVAQHDRLMHASGWSLLGLIGAKSYEQAERAAVDRATYWLDRIGLTRRADDAAGTLPYGDQRRLEIVRAMCTEPMLLCLDEPAAGLNPKETSALNALLRAIRDEHDTSILLIEHDMSVVMEISDHVVVLEYGLLHLRRDARERAQRSQGHRRLSRRRGRRGRASRSGGRPMSAPLLSLERVTACYGNIAALHGVDITVPRGEIVTLIGANGAGKSTLMMTIFGNPRAREGRILFDGQDITALPTHQIARLGVAVSPEGRRIFARMTVEENLRLGGEFAGNADFATGLEHVAGIFPRLKERLAQRGGTLSGGEQQMLAIARALMSRPKLLLLDEPSLGLAPLIVKQIFKVIADLNAREGLTVFLVEQNAFHALRLAHRAYVMVNGAITLSGTGQQLLASPEVRAAYLEGGRH